MHRSARRLLPLVAVLVSAVPADAQLTPTQPYLMAFHGCEGTACRDPQNHRVYLAESANGAVWTMVPGWTTYAGSVPDVIQRDRTIYIYTANSMVFRYDLDTGTSDRVRVQVTGLPSGRASDWVDPSLVVDDANRLVLFLMYAPLGSGDPARCATGVTSCTKQFFSATEVPGSNGTQFALDPGERATATIPSTGPGSAASDPDVFFDGTQYVMYISHGTSTSVWTSSALRGTYTKSTRLAQGLLSNNQGGVPAGHFDAATARYWTYVHTASQPGGATIIRRAVHATLTEAPADSAWTTIMTGAGMALNATTSVESPSFTTLTLTPPAAAPEPVEPYPASCPGLSIPGPIVHSVVGDTLELDWGGSGGASQYLIEAGIAPGRTDAAVAVPDTTATIRLPRNATYHVRVRARNGCSDSPPSDEITATLP